MAVAGGEVAVAGGEVAVAGGVVAVAGGVVAVAVVIRFAQAEGRLYSGGVP